MRAAAERAQAEAETPKKDGRRERSARTHRAIVAALLDLVDEGNLEPTAPMIAARAGVALRSIRQHFASREELFLAALAAHAARVSPPEGSIDARMTLPERIAAFSEVRARELELSAPIRRAASFVDGGDATPPAKHASRRDGVGVPTAIGRAVAATWQRRRNEAAHVFAREIAQSSDEKAMLDAIDLLSHGRTWDTLRSTLGLSYADATAMLRRTLAGVLRA